MSVIKIPLKLGPFQVFTIVDKKDYDKFNLGSYNWRCRYDHEACQVYARKGSRATKGSITFMLHRLLTNCPKGMVVDHIDGDGLNNRRKNLRICTPAENAQNVGKPTHRKCQSKYLGVSRDDRKKLKKPWRVLISVGNKTKNCGYYATEIEAAKARDKFVLKYRGKFARLNFPKGVKVNVSK